MAAAAPEAPTFLPDPRMLLCLPLSPSIGRSGAKFSSRVSTKLGYDTIRLPFNTFRPLDFDGALEVDPKEVTHISFKFEPKRVWPPSFVPEKDNSYLGP